ncbi:MAG: dihydropteroate synthase [Treponema sp.]|nr:dihydropteroate synthase [Treponema sp.]
MDFSGPALVMAVVNCNSDSFYAPSRALLDDAVEKALAAEREGAAIVDFGAESTRPGAAYISAEEELARLLPVIEAFRKRSSLPVSVDTRKAAVAAAVLDAGADIINDISGLFDDEAMARLCAARGAAVVLMHKKGVPLTMQENPRYNNLVEELQSWFKTAAEYAAGAGIMPEKIILDPGIGFGKSLEDNLEILRHLVEILGKDYPVLVGLSRKSFIGEITGRSPADALAGTLAANAAAIIGGADIIRVHDVKEHADLAKVLFALGC